MLNYYWLIPVRSNLSYLSLSSFYINDWSLVIEFESRGYCFFNFVSYIPDWLAEMLLNRVDPFWLKPVYGILNPGESTSVYFSSHGMLEMSSSSKLPSRSLPRLGELLLLDLFLGDSERSFICKYLLSPVMPEFSLTLEFIFKRFDFFSFFLSRALNPDLNSVVRRKLSDYLEGE